MSRMGIMKLDAKLKRWHFEITWLTIGICADGFWSDSLMHLQAKGLARSPIGGLTIYSSEARAALMKTPPPESEKLWKS